MSKKKHKQNQSLVSDETKNKVVSDSQQNESQPDATNPQEHGRSMTEMLGVLAVLGVLSIGGVQGYRYAMNKYHSNEVINELNLLNAQLAVFMNGIHDDEAVMSLGEPYDNGETINAGGYAFSYGCGQDPDSTTPCDLDETGYYMTLDGVPEDVCKSASQMTANMMNLVEQRINGHTDNKGILCQDGDNQLVFLFDANEGQGFENGEGEEGDNGDVTDAHYPDTTEQYEEETTTIFETTTTHTGTETGTYSVGGECQTNSDCGNGYYCHFCGGNCDIKPNYGECWEIDSMLREKSSSAPFWISKYSNINYWSANNLCQAKGMRLVSLNDFDCPDSNYASGYGWCATSKAIAMGEAYNYSYAWTTSNCKEYGNCIISESAGICGSGCLSNALYAICTDDNPSWVEPTTTTQYATTTYTQTATADCANAYDADKVQYAYEYCASRGGVMEAAYFDCNLVKGNGTGRKCEGLQSWATNVKNQANKYYIIGIYLPGDSTFAHCKLPYGINVYSNSEVWVTWANDNQQPLCKNDYYNLNQEVTATIFETTPYQTASYVVTNPTHSSIWLGPNEVYSRTAAREYCENNGGVLAKVADVGCTNIVSSTCNITVNLHPHDWTIFDDYEASWSNDSIYVDAQTSVTTQYGSYPVCVPK